MAIQVYSELLFNIRVISVVASLPSPASKSHTEATVDADAVKVKHEGEVRVLKLPGKTALAPSRLPITNGQTLLSWRLPLAAVDTRRDASEPEVPWAATDLCADDKLLCRKCRCLLMGGVKAWKDLPSENWAEMMEFWHCHKPDHKHAHGDGRADDETLAARGYGANSVIKAQRSVGLVDLASFLLHEDDCAGVLYGRGSAADAATTVRSAVGTSMPETETPRNLHMFCGNCSAQVGYYNFKTAAATLFKWTVAVSDRREQPDVHGCLALTLATTMARCGTSKALIMPIQHLNGGNSASGTVLHTWVLSSDIQYSSTGADGTVPAMRLLFRILNEEEADKILGSFVDDVPEINLPPSDLSAVMDELARTNSLLPTKDRTFQEWTVGLLTKWQGAS